MPSHVCVRCGQPADVVSSSVSHCAACAAPVLRSRPADVSEYMALMCDKWDAYATASLAPENIVARRGLGQMPCVKCGLNEAVTTAGLCKECAGKVSQSSYVYASSCSHCAEAQALEAQAHEVMEAGTSIPGQCIDQFMLRIAKETMEAHAHKHRLPWDVYFLAICDAVKLRSIDKDTQNGAVIVNEHKRIVSTGYNAFPAGVDDDFWPKDRETKVRVPCVGVPRLGSAGSRGVPGEALLWKEQGKFYEVDKYMAMTHAEMNAVVAAGQDLHRCCIYTLLFPCHECAKAIITSGIKRVVFVTTRENVSWAVAKELFLQAGVEMVGPETP